MPAVFPFVPAFLSSSLLTEEERSVQKRKMKLEFLKIVVPAFLGVIITKLWDPIAEYVGYPLDVPRRVENFQDAVQRLLSIQADLHRLDPRSSSEQGKGWVQSVQNLCLKAEKIKTGYCNTQVLIHELIELITVISSKSREQ